jgi:N-carbamoyl-L-amino-acid hydrolase
MLCPMSIALHPERVVGELKELRVLTGDDNGGAAGGFHAAVGEGAIMAEGEVLGRCRWKCTTMRRGTSGRLCAGESEKALLIGGHIDSVPNGGWLDGCLNTLAGLEILGGSMRSMAAILR